MTDENAGIGNYKGVMLCNRPTEGGPAPKERYLPTRSWGIGRDQRRSYPASRTAISSVSALQSGPMSLRWPFRSENVSD